MTYSWWNLPKKPGPGGPPCEGGVNTANGRGTLLGNTSGSQNAAHGSEALLFNIDGNNNTASGYDALYHNKSGSYNTADGWNALYGNVGGLFNVALGAGAGGAPTNGFFNIHIGNAGLENDNHVLRLGTKDQQTATFIAGIYGTTVTNGAVVCVDSTGQLGTGANVFLSDKDLLLRGSADSNHGLGWYGQGKSFGGISVDGPMLYGYGGGGLGTIHGGTNAALVWTSAGNVGIGCVPQDFRLDVQGDVRLNLHDLFLGQDRFHGLGWYGAGKLFAGGNVDGPVLYGYSGGGLGSTGNGSTSLALAWNKNGSVAIDPLGANGGALLPGLTFGWDSGEGIASKRSSGGNQWGLDFFTGYQTRLTITQGGKVGIGTATPATALDVNGSVTLSGSLNLPAAPTIYAGGDTLLHVGENGNFFAGSQAGNLADTTIWNWGNTGIGQAALANSSNSALNTAVGWQTLNHHTNGSANTALGSQALFYHLRGGDNTVVGSGAVYSLTNGSDNIVLGSGAGYNLFNGSHNILIGNSGKFVEDGTIRLGTAGTHDTTYIAGLFGRTAAFGVPVYVTDLGQLGTLPSSRRFKQDIQEMGEASKGLLALRPVTFQYRSDIDPHATPQFGLIAEEVEQVNPDLVVRDEQGRVNAVRNEAVNAMLLNEFLKHHRKLEDLGRKVEVQQAENAELKRELTDLKHWVEQLVRESRP